MAHFLKINWASGSVCINHHVAAVWIPSTVYNDENKPKIGRESAIYFLKKNNFPKYVPGHNSKESNM